MTGSSKRVEWRLQTGWMEAPNGANGGSKRGEWRLQTPSMVGLRPQNLTKSYIKSMSPLRKNYSTEKATKNAVQPLPSRHWQGNIAYLKARMFCRLIPAISPYLRHGCMAGYPYLMPLASSPEDVYKE